jgi:hypothetical protein
MEDFFRDKKEVICSGGVNNPYDILVLTNSLQYKLDKEVFEKNALPENGMVNLQDVNFSSELVRSYMQELLDEKTKIIIYGSTLDAFGALYSLVKDLNIPPSKIIMVSPDGNEGIFVDEAVSSQVELVLRSQGIKYYPHYSLKDFVEDDYGNLSRVFLISNSKNADDEDKEEDRLLNLPCSLLINCHSRDIEDRLLITINRESLVFDSRLIVEPNFLTIDPCVYAAGPLTKFSRRFGESLPVENYNSSELGQLVAAAMLKNIGLSSDSEQNDVLKIPKFKKKVLASMPIIGGHYLYVSNTADFKKLECTKLITNNLNRNKGIEPKHYVSLYINKKTGRIECFCYFGNEKIEQNNYSSLVGIPVTYFNNLIVRYHEGLIKDFIEYFRENWVYCLYCHSFKQLRDKLNKYLSNRSDVSNFMKQIIESMKRQDIQELTSSEYLKDLPDKISQETKRYLEKELLQFLDKNQKNLQNIPFVYFLPHYQ